MSAIDTTPGVYTSTTRPAVPFIGQTIFEKDTGKIMVYYGGTTGWMPRWFHDWGEIAGIKKVTNFSPSTTGVEDIPGTEIIFQSIRGRFITAYMSCCFLANDNITGSVFLNQSVAGGAYAVVGTLIAEPASALKAVYRQVTFTSFYQTGVSAPLIKYKASCQKTGAGGPMIILIGSTEPFIIKAMDVGAQLPPIIG